MRIAYYYFNSSSVIMSCVYIYSYNMTVDRVVVVVAADTGCNIRFTFNATTTAVYYTKTNHTDIVVL